MGLLNRVEQRASLENPSTSLANPDAWLVDALGGGATAAGKNVNHQNALKLSAVWACVKVLSEDVAKLPLITYRRLDRGKERAMDHPLFRVLHSQANPEMSAYNFRRTLQSHVVTWGKAFAEIERNRAGEVVALWPLLPDRTEVHRVNGQKIVVTRVNGEDIPLRARDVLHIPGLGFDGLRGYSVIGHAKLAIGSAMAAEEYGASFFGNGARPGGIVTTDKTMSEEAQQRFRSSWNKVHQGLTGAQRVALLDEGMSYQDIGIPPDDAQFLGTRQHGVEDIVRYFRIPPHKVQHLLHAGVRANVESENRSYVSDTLQPWLVGWEQEINRWLFDGEERDTFFAEHVVEGLLRGNSEARANFYQSGINNGWLSPNDVREMENRNPVDGGDQLFVRRDLMPLDSPFAELDIGGFGEDGEPDDEADDDMASNAARLVQEQRARRSVDERHRIQESHRKGFRSTAQTVIRKEVEGLTGLIDKHYGERQGADFMADVERFYDGFDDTVRDLFMPLVTSYAEMVKRIGADELGRDTFPDLQYEQFVEDYAEGLARRHVRKSRSQIKRIVRDTTPEDQEDELRRRLAEWEEGENEATPRADKVAMTEPTRAMGAFSKTAYVLAGVIMLVWRTIGQNCPYCERLSGRVISKQENFASKGEVIDPDERIAKTGEHRQGPMMVKSHVGHPPLHAGCDCVISPALI